ncbi:hypothetical protein D3C87_1864310 [compost metagenome]
MPASAMSSSFMTASRKIAPTIIEDFVFSLVNPVDLGVAGRYLFHCGNRDCAEQAGGR